MHHQMAINGLINSRKKAGRFDDMEFPGVYIVLKKKHVEFARVNYKRSGFFWGNQEKMMWYF